jgi:hypothetical protein
MNTTVEYFYPKKNENYRLFALGYFSTLITLWAIAGKTILGFEQSTAQMLAAVSAAIFMQFILEYVDSISKNREPRYKGSFRNAVQCLMPAIIPGFAVGFLIYPNELIWPMVFAACLSIASKVIFRAPVGDRFQHIFNPSNFGITLTLLMFPWIGLAPPYHFTGHVYGIWHWVIPAFILLSGIFVHGLFTGRLPLVLAWLAGFVLQGLIRSWYFDVGWNVPLVPMTSAAFILFTLYMIPDPATTPLNTLYQIIFGFLVALIYGVLILYDVVFGLFISLFLVCMMRGFILYFIYFKEIIHLRLTSCGFCSINETA